MLVRISDVTTTARHVEMPEKCPDCGAAVTQSISEINWSDSFIPGSLTLSEGDEPGREALHEFEHDDGAMWEHGEQYFVVGYRCGECSYILVESEFSEME